MARKVPRSEQGIRSPASSVSSDEAEAVSALGLCAVGVHPEPKGLVSVHHQSRNGAAADVAEHVGMLAKVHVSLALEQVNVQEVNSGAAAACSVGGFEHVMLSDVNEWDLVIPIAISPTRTGRAPVHRDACLDHTCEAPEARRIVTHRYICPPCCRACLQHTEGVKPNRRASSPQHGVLKLSRFGRRDLMVERLRTLLTLSGRVRDTQLSNQISI